MKNLTWLLIFLLIPVSLDAATFTVTNTNNSGTGSFRQALTDANSTAGSDTINVSLGSVTEATVTLQSALPIINEGVTLEGPTGTVVTINANGTGSVFDIDSPGNNQTVNMSRLVIKGGNSGGLDGGGIYIGLGDTFNLTDASVESNSAGSGSGGGIYNRGISTFTRVTVAANSAGTDGGGIYSDIGGTITFANSTISGNTADRDGGGLYYGGGSITLNNVTVTNNVADNDYPANNLGDGGGINGGGVVSNNAIVVISSIVAGNIDKDNGDNGNGTWAPDCETLLLSLYSLIGITDRCSFSSFSENNRTGNSFSPKDPKLSALSNNGGFGKTHSLQAESPAIDAGNIANQGINACFSTDQRGFSRPKDGDANGSVLCDMGAFEIVCGDSMTQSGAGEECDDGNTNNADSCTNSCKNARCGDGIVGPSETCDDGNTANGDGCDGSCKIEVAPVAATPPASSGATGTSPSSGAVATPSTGSPAPSGGTGGGTTTPTTSETPPSSSSTPTSSSPESSGKTGGCSLIP